MSYDDVEDARLYDVQNPWGPADDFYRSLVPPDGDVLDVGCGTGGLLKRLRRDGSRGRLVGLDPSAGMLAVAREAPDIEWVHGFLAPGAYDAEFDLVTMTGHAFLDADALDRHLAAAGLDVLARYGDWDRSPTGPEIITVATRSA